MTRCSVLIDIVTQEELCTPSTQSGYGLNSSTYLASDPYSDAARRRVHTSPTPQKLVFNRLLDRITMTVDSWRIRSKLTAIVLSEDVFSGEEQLFLSPSLSPSPSNTLELQGSHKVSRGYPNGTTELSYEESHCDATTLPPQRERIPIISCVARTLTNIIEQAMSHDEVLERRFVAPMSRAMFRVLTDNEFRLTEAATCWPTHLRLPMHKPSLWELGSVLGYFAEHIDTVQGTIKRACENHSYDFLFVLKDEVLYLHSMVNIFINAVRSLSVSRSSYSTSNGFGSGSYSSGGEHMTSQWFSENLSAAIPALRDVLKSLEELPLAVSDEVRTLGKLAAESTKRHLMCMEQQDIFLCATLLDPRYKQGYFSCKEVVDSAERMVLDAFEEERRKGDGQKNAKNVDALLNGCVGASGSLEQYMTSIIPDTSSGSGCLTQFLNEQQAERWGGEEFWKRNLSRWPVLSRVAGRYCLTPGVCESEQARSEIEREQSMRAEGDTRKKEQMSEKLRMAFLRKSYMQGNN
ncbi:Ribonuclease H-like protein [Gracilaria domingensis]|nr:Ribonuclease H-like protein [Gracilaria domingensis]